MEFANNPDLNVGASVGAGATSAAVDEARSTNVITMPLQFIGIFCNVIVLWVWSAERDYVPSTYLFKALAVSDILFLQFHVVLHVYRYPGYTHDKVLFADVFFAIVAFGNQKNGLLISLVLATSRVIKLFFPLHARRLLAKSRMRIVVICCLTYSIGFMSCIRTTGIYSTDDNQTAIKLKSFIWAGWGYLLPASLQIVLMLAVVCKVLRQKANIAPLVIDLSSRRRSEENSKTEVERNSCFPTEAESFQFVYVVLAICYMSFVAYIIPASLLFLGEDHPARRPAKVTSILLISINCGINIIFYMFIPRFRDMFTDNIKRLLQTIGVSNTTRTSSEGVGTATSRRNTGGKDGERDGERTETDQEEGIAETDNNLPNPPSLKRLAKKGEFTCTT